jgi:radical SAM superfamily enzyme YgiQ (UPF0313 family)
VQNQNPGHTPNLRDAGAIVLVSCYELGHQPQGLALPLAFLERAGFRPAALDLAVEPLDPRPLARARFVAISAPMHTAMRMGLHVARKVRDINPDALIAFHGLYAPLNREFLSRGLADFVLGGECEADLVKIAREIEEGESERETRPSRKVTHTLPIALRKLDFPVPSRTALPKLDRYAQLDDGESQRLAGYVESTRGCLHFCRHCPIPAVYAGRFFTVPVPTLLEDVRQQVASGATHITFGDADFLNGPGHARRVLQTVHAEFPTLTFDFTAKVEHLIRNRTLLPELASCGVLFVITAVESLSDRVLQELQKGHTRSDVDDALNILRSAGMAVRPSLLPFTPWSTLDDYFDLLDWIDRESLEDSVDPVQLTIRLLIPPGSLLLESPEARPYLGSFDEEALSFQWTHPDPSIDELQREAARLVEHCAMHREEPRITLQRLRRLASALREDSETRACVTGAEGRVRKRAPRLTEPWFC